MSNLAIGGNVGRRRYILERHCEESVGHLHAYDHMTLVVKGGIRVTIRDTKDGPIISERDYWPGSEPIYIAANKYHTIKNITPKVTDDERLLWNNIIEYVGLMPIIGEKAAAYLKKKVILNETCIYFCLFSHRDFDGFVSQEFMGNMRAYD